MLLDILPDTLGVCARPTWDDPIDERVSDKMIAKQRREKYAMSKEMNNWNLVP